MNKIFFFFFVFNFFLIIFYFFFLVNEPAFFVFSTKSENFIEVNSFLKFDSIDLNTHDFYTENSNETQIVKSGMYFFGLNFYFSKFKNELLLLNSSQRYEAKIVSYQRIQSGNTSKSQIGFTYFSNNSRISIQVHYIRASLYSTEGKTVSWLMFRYETDDYLYASPGIKLYDTYAPDTVNFYQIRDINGFTTDDNRTFYFENDGYYFIGFSICPGKGIISVEVSCYLNGTIIVQSGIWRSKSVKNDAFSKAFVYYFRKFDQISCKVLDGYIRGFAATALTIFRLKPKPFPLVYISLDKDFNGDETENVIPFNKIFVNEQNYWNPNTYEYVIKIPGVYLLYLGIGASENTTVFIEIQKNNKMFATLEKSEEIEGFEIISRTLLIKLNFEDKIKFISKMKTRLQWKYFTTSFVMFFVSS